MIHFLGLHCKPQKLSDIFNMSSSILRVGALIDSLLRRVFLCNKGMSCSKSCGITTLRSHVHAPNKMTALPQKQRGWFPDHQSSANHISKVCSVHTIICKPLQTISQKCAQCTGSLELGRPERLTNIEMHLLAVE